MSWIKQNSNLYTHSDAPFSLQYIGSTWYLVDNRDQSKAIPFSDIFNNPAYPIDFSNQDVSVNSLSSASFVNATHLRSETANTPATPGHSFKNEISSGLYRESSGVLGFSILGTKTSQIDTNGVLNGSIGVDYRNLIKRTRGQLTNLASPTTSSSSTITTHVSSGIGFAYTASNINSRLIIRLQLSTRTEFSGSTGGVHRNSFFRTYIDTSSVPILGVSPPGTSTQINSNENYIGSAYNDGVFSYYNGSFLNHTFEVNPSSLSARYYYLSFRTDSTNCQITFFTATGSYYALYTVEEYL